MATNTTMKKDATVYAGPHANNFVRIGTVYSGEPVTVQWREGNWLYIRYTVDSTGQYKCGYVPNGSANATAADISSEISYNPRYVNTTANTYYGGGPGYEVAGTVYRGERIDWLGHKVAGSDGKQYAFIEYNVDGTNQKKRAYFYTNYLSLSEPT